MIRRTTSLIVLLFAVLVAPFAAAPSHEASAQVDGAFYREVVFDSAEVVPSDEASPAFSGFAPASLAAFSISCTEDSGTATLDVAIQRSVNGGTVWANIVAFTQLAATGSETKLYADVRAASAQMIGDTLRVNYDITGTGQYTCAVTGALEA